MSTIDDALMDKEYMKIVIDLLVKEEVLKLGDFVQHHACSRLEHCINVSYLSYTIAKNRGLDFVSTARAGLLHDLFYYDWKTTKFDEGSHAYMHPRIALSNAKKITTINKLEEDIIVKHMFGATIAPPKYAESWIVTGVDKYCAIKEFSSTLTKKEIVKKIFA